MFWLYPTWLTKKHSSSYSNNLFPIRDCLICKDLPFFVAEKNAKGDTALHIATNSGDVLLVSLFLDSNYKDGNTALHEATRFLHYKIAQILIDRNMNMLYSVKKEGKSLLYLDAEAGFIDIVRLLKGNPVGVYSEERKIKIKSAVHAAIHVRNIGGHVAWLPFLLLFLATLSIIYSLSSTQRSHVPILGQSTQRFTYAAHSLNAVLLLGETALNCLHFPYFRIAYFILLTGIFVIFEWAVHASVSMWWSYPFLDLSLPYAPLWYLMVALLHLPCYSFFALIVAAKSYMLSKWFPQSHQCLR